MNSNQEPGDELMKALKGKVAVVTGAGQGNGRAIALRLASTGASVFCTDLRPDLLQDLEQEGTKSGFDIETGIYDARLPSDASNLISRVSKKYGGLDIMVNNAGGIKAQPFLEVTEETWDWTIDLNLKGLFFHMQSAAIQMVQQGSGTIINLASVAGIDPGLTLSPPYAASKSAVMNLTKSAAVKLAEFGITVNAVAPGIVKTAFNTTLDNEIGVATENLPQGEWLRLRAAGIPLGRISVPEDVAGVVAFLAGPDGSYITGETITVSGGLNMR